MEYGATCIMFAEPRPLQRTLEL